MILLPRVWGEMLDVFCDRECESIDTGTPKGDDARRSVIFEEGGGEGREAYCHRQQANPTETIDNSPRGLLGPT